MFQHFHSREMLAYLYQDICKKMITAELFLKTKTIAIQLSWMNDYIGKLWHIHTMEY